MSIRSFYPHGFSLALAVLALATISTRPSAQQLQATQIVSGLSSPLYLCSPPGDTTRLFILEQNTGRVRIIRAGAVLATPYLNISTLLSTGGERGLLGMAFHPNYASNGFFYVAYTDTAGASRIRRFTVSAGNPDVADALSGVNIYGPITQPFSNHNGGCLQFGPDSKLYHGLGDGGSGGDPGNRAQDLTTPLGKMLRFDVDIPSPYIPLDNPFIGMPGVPGEIYALGLRNPWRFSFDRFTGDLWIGDVGQGAIEEVDFTPAASTGGENYGWRCMEGATCTGLSGCTCFAPVLTAPIHTYNHSGGNCSITGGYAYRGSNIPCFQGTYFFADYCNGRIWTLRYDGAVVSNLVERTAEMAIPGSETITSFGEDANGEVYIVDASGGEIWRIDPRPSTLLCGDCAAPADAAVTILDAFAAAQITVQLLAPTISQNCLCDTNADAEINVIDALMMALDSVGSPITLTCP